MQINTADLNKLCYVVFDNTDLSDAVTVAGDQQIVTSAVRSIFCDVVKMSLHAR